MVTSSTVEFSTGIYGLYGQLALTLIAAFLLLAGVANGFEAQRAMINVVRLIAGRSRQLIPQTAVVGSSAIGMISGSGSANAAVVGTITIPLMIRYGVPAAFAAAVETAASMGGLIMPPMMGVGAFLMSEFLGVPYWDVVLRGFALAFVYYVSIGIAVYLLCVRLLPRDAIETPNVPLYDKIKTAIFFSSVLYLIYLMGVVGKGELLAALIPRPSCSSCWPPPSSASNTCRGSGARQRDAVRQRPARDRNACRDDLLSDAAARHARHHDRPVHRNRLHQPHGRDAGRPRRLEHGRHDLHGLALRLARRSRPAADATYIIGAVVIVPPMKALGIDPWVAHFFVFLMSVWGELSPPTSLTAAVSARIANASFLKTMYEALKICAPITLMTFAIFTRSNMVVNPGWLQIADTTLVLDRHLGITFAMFGRTHENPAVDIAIRCLLAAISFVVMFHPDTRVSAAVAVVVLAGLVLGIWQHRKIAPPKTAIAAPSEMASPSGDLAPILAEAKRDVG